MADRNHFIEEIISNFQTPIEVGTVMDIPSIVNTIIPREATGYVYSFDDIPNSKITVTNPDGIVETVATGIANNGSYIVKRSGMYTIRYIGAITRVSFNPASSDTSKFTVKFTIAAVSNADPLPKWNIRTVIERVLSLCEPRMKDQPPRYKLDPAQAKQFEQIEAPEFAFTNKTLKEILDAIGGFIHGIPRLVRGTSGRLDTIHYDMLGGTEVAKLCDRNKYPYVGENWSTDLEEYADELDSAAENLVNTLDSAEGAVTEPYIGGYKSVRSEELYARITDGNMVISTTLPIYTVQKLEVLSPEKGIEADITAYLFEGADYGRLSSYDGVFPTSKAFAIYYEQGQRDIKGLSYKSPNVLGGAGAKYSIANIIYAATGEDISSDWWADKNNGDTSGNYPKLLFRITYTPVFSARVLQHKPNITKGALKRRLFYNQTANLTETQYYGENMKGAVMRIGQPTFIRKYRDDHVSYPLPKPGQLWYDYGKQFYIAAVTVAEYADFRRLMVEMTEDFNRLSQYIGINAEWRAYEVSEKKAFNRDYVYADYCVIGAGADAKQQVDCLANKYGFNWIANTFAQDTSLSNLKYCVPISLAVVTTYEAGGAARKVSLPVVSVAMGNTLAFSFGMEDNWSAGPKSVYYSSGNVSGYWQTDVSYTDYYGRVDSMQFDLMPAGKDIGVGDGAAFDLPQGDRSVALKFVEFSSDQRLAVEKDSKEILRIGYQIRYVTTMENLIIGPALTRNCPLVRTARRYHAAAVYVLSEEISKFAATIDRNKAVKIYDYGKNPPKATSTLRLNLGANDNNLMPTTKSGKAWAIADQATGEILLAQNIAIEAGSNINLPDISFAHTID